MIAMIELTENVTLKYSFIIDDLDPTLKCFILVQVNMKLES